MKHFARRCSAQRKDGRPCRAWAVRDSEEALCASHRNKRGPAIEVSSFYERAYTVAEAADLLYQAEEKNLKEELGLTRIAVRRVLEQLKEELDPAEYVRLIELIFKGTHTIASIVRAQRSLSGADKDLLPPEMAEALTEVGQEIGADL